MKANNLTQATKELSAQGVDFKTLNVSEDIKDHDGKFYHYICIEAVQQGLSVSLKARVVKVNHLDVAKGTAIDMSNFKKVVVLHDPTIKPPEPKKAAPKKAGTGDEAE